MFNRPTRCAVVAIAIGGRGEGSASNNTGMIMRRRPFLSATLVIAISVSGCERSARDGNGTTESPGFTVWDSAGVEIVENHAPQRPAGGFWAIAPELETVLGGADDLTGWANDSTQLIWEVVGLVRLLDGRVAVLLSENERLFLFEPSGELSRTIGRAGDGPGEFTRPEHLQYLPPDTLVVWDYHMRSIDYFDTSGRLAKERPVDHTELRERVTGARRAGPTGGPAVERVLPAREFLMRVDSTYAAQRLGCSGFIAAGGHPPSIYVSGNHYSEIRQFTLDGVLLRIIRRTTDPVPITAKAQRASEDRIAREFEARGVLPPPTGFLDSGDSGKTYPWVAGLMVDTEGYLWVREWSASETGIPDQWSVLSPEGRWLDVLAVPVDPGPMDPTRCSWASSCWIDRKFFLTLRVGELGVERVEAYRIRRGS